jgi:AcrR family transcriptional regulator
MEIESTATAVQDRRVRRSRAALMHAAISLVSERGTAAIAISDIADAADVSRPVVYQHFGDRDTLLLESALDLAARELLPRIIDAADTSSRRDRTLAVARHFADHRVFYRAVLTSSCGFALNRSLSEMLVPVNRQLLQDAFGAALDAQSTEDLATFLTGGAAAFVNTWVVEGEDPLDPEEFTDRLLRILPIAATPLHPSPTTPDPEPH